MMSNTPAAVRITTRCRAMVTVVSALSLACLLAGCDRAGTEVDDTSAETSSAGNLAAPKLASTSVSERASRASQEGAGASTVAEGTPQLTFKSTVYDFGTMSETEQKQFSYEFTNTGTTDLVLSHPKAACGCTVPTLRKYRYAPGESGTIDVAFDPPGPGEMHKTIKVLSNVDDHAVELLIQGSVEPFIMIEPPAVILGKIEYGIEHSTMLFISSPDPGFELVSVTSDNPDLQIRVVDTSREPVAAPPDVNVVEVTLPDTAIWGGHYGAISIVGRGKPRPELPTTTHTSNIRFAAQTLGNMHGVPDSFRVGIAPGKHFNTRVALSSADGQKFDLLGATPAALSSVPDLELTTRSAGPNGYELILTGTAPTRPGQVTGRVIVRTTLPGFEVLEIPIQVMVTG